MKKYLEDVKLKYEGKVFKTNQFGDLIVLKYNNAEDVEVMFLDTKYTTSARMQCIKHGRVRDFLKPFMFGVGFITKTVGSKDKNYSTWQRMLERCYETKCQSKYPTYIGCTVSENFKYLEYFSKWCVNQIGFDSKDEKGRPFQLDKDILLKGNKVYSEDTCCFVPAEINTLFTKSNKSRGKYLIGVSYVKHLGKYVAYIRAYEKSNYLGVFSTEAEAFYAYKQAKESRVKDLANKWKDEIDPRAYNALMNYEVEMHD